MLGASRGSVVGRGDMLVVTRVSFPAKACTDISNVLETTQTRAFKTKTSVSQVALNDGGVGQKKKTSTILAWMDGDLASGRIVPWDSKRRQKRRSLISVNSDSRVIISDSISSCLMSPGVSDAERLFQLASQDHVVHGPSVQTRPSAGPMTRESSAKNPGFTEAFRDQT